MVNWKVAASAASGLGEVAARLWRIARVLFHEVIGFLFLALTGWGLLWLLKSWREFQGDSEALFKIGLVTAFVLMMGSFGVSSFWRARRISRGR